MTTPHGLGYVKMVIMVDEDVDPFNLPQVMWALSSKVNPAGDLVQLPNMSVLELDPGSSPAGITDKLIIDATTPVAPDNRGHYSQPVQDLPETKAGPKTDRDAGGTSIRRKNDLSTLCR